MQLNLNAYRLKIDCYRWTYVNLMGTINQKLQKDTNNEDQGI